MLTNLRLLNNAVRMHTSSAADRSTDFSCSLAHKELHYVSVAHRAQNIPLVRVWHESPSCFLPMTGATAGSQHAWEAYTCGGNSSGHGSDYDPGWCCTAHHAVNHRSSLILMLPCPAHVYKSR